MKKAADAEEKAKQVAVKSKVGGALGNKLMMKKFKKNNLVMKFAQKWKKIRP